MGSNVAVKGKNGVATVAPAAVPAFLQEQKMTGAGVSTAKDDILIPMATVLQSQSPQCMPRNPAQIEGAAAGDIYIKNAPRPLLPGDIGFLFQSCFFEKAIVEWKPRGSGGGGGAGFVVRHNYAADGEWPKELKADSEERPDPQNPERKLIFRKSTGNVLVETRYHAGFVVTPDGSAPPMPLVLPFASSGHSVSRAWMFLMGQKIVGTQKVDSWAVYYRVKTRMRSRGDQNWFVFDIVDAGPQDETKNPTTMWCPTVADYERGRALFNALTEGTMKFGDDEAGHDDAPASSESRAEAAGV